jgi:hypothetical protein
MMVKSGIDFFILKANKPLQGCCCPGQKICPERLNCPGQLAGISERASSISNLKMLKHFSPSFLSKKW